MLAVALLLPLLHAAAVAAAPERPAVARQTPLLRMTIDPLPERPMTVTVSRIILTPGTADEARILAGPRLVLVGQLP